MTKTDYGMSGKRQVSMRTGTIVVQWYHGGFLQSDDAIMFDETAAA